MTTFLVSVLTGLGLAVYRGIVLSILWTWFVVRIFEVRPITWVEAIGFSMVVAFLTYQHHDTEKTTEWWETALVGVIYYTVILLFGWFVSLFL